MLTDEQKKLIGGSDSAALAGVHPYKTALDVWRRIVEGHEVEETKPMRRGNLLEPVIKQMYVDETGAKLLGSLSIASTEYPWARSSLDDVAVRDGSERVLECKSANLRMLHTYGEGVDDVPMEHVCQTNWYMRFKRCDLADLAVLLGGDDLRVYTLRADVELQEMLLHAAEKFWVDHVLTKTPPPIDGSESCSEWLKSRYPENRGVWLPASAEVELLAQQLRHWSDKADEASERVEHLRNELRAIIGDADGIEGDGWKISWKKNKDGQRIDWEALADHLLRWCVAPEVRASAHELIAKHTTTKPGPRVFRLAPTKKGNSNASQRAA